MRETLACAWRDGVSGILAGHIRPCLTRGCHNGNYEFGMTIEYLPVCGINMACVVIRGAPEIPTMLFGSITK